VKLVLRAFTFGLKMYSLLLGCAFSIPTSFSEILSILGLLPFSA
jgi:hypothetical protein